jgi:6-phospho-beta-glucosidase
MWLHVLEGYVSKLESNAHADWNPDLIRSLQMVPNYYLHYFYDTELKLAEQGEWPPSRAEQVMEIEAALLAQYAEPDRTEPPEGLMKRGGAYYSTVATQLLNAHYNDLQEIHVVNVRQGGAVSDWDADWVLEMPCMVGRNGIIPIPTKPLPFAQYGLVAQVKMYELLTVEAAVHGDRAAAYQALLANPLGPDASNIRAVLEDMLETHRAYLPQFSIGN